MYTPLSPAGLEKGVAGGRNARERDWPPTSASSTKPAGYLAPAAFARDTRADASTAPPLR